AFATSALPTAGLNLPSEATLLATGGTAPYAWTLLPGSTTPPGIVFDDATGEISGVATTAGSYTLNVQVADSAAAILSKAFDLSVALDIADLTAEPGPARGSVVLRFTAPPTSGGPPVPAYVVKSSVRHVSSAADLLAAALVPQAYVPGAPGAAEAITLSGLDPGQTLQ